MPTTRWLVTGSTGQLGTYLLDALRDQSVTAWGGKSSVDLTDPDAVAVAWSATKPDIVIHAAAMARIDECYRDPVTAHRTNVDATTHLAAYGARIVLVSTDLVFDGECAPYREEDHVSPLSVYGRTKADAEAAVRCVPNSAIVRVSLLTGPSRNGRPNFWDKQADAMRLGRPVTLFADEWRTPIGYLAAAQAIVAIAQSDATGTWHVGGPERLSRLEMGQRLAKSIGIAAPTIASASRLTGASEPRPRDVSLDVAKWRSAFPNTAWPTFEKVW
ncbi:MAG: SDR family oxidoreductase [Gemmataceae bacterium]